MTAATSIAPRTLEILVKGILLDGLYIRVPQPPVNQSIAVFGSDFDCHCGTMSTGDKAPNPRTPPSDEERDRKDDETA